jgi:hypothetical protein
MSVNPQRFCAILLISGLVVFMVGAVLWKLDFQSRDLGHVLRSVAGAGFGFTHGSRPAWC